MKNQKDLLSVEVPFKVEVVSVQERGTTVWAEIEFGPLVRSILDKVDVVLSGAKIRGPFSFGLNRTDSNKYAFGTAFHNIRIPEHAPAPMRKLFVGHEIERMLLDDLVRVR